MGDRLATIDMDQKLGGCAPFGRGSWVSNVTQCAWAEAYLRTKWHLDPSSCLATTDTWAESTAQPAFIVNSDMQILKIPLQLLLDSSKQTDKHSSSVKRDISYTARIHIPE